MPAPAVIPAPRAYINAVAVKGFVVELWSMILSRDPVLFPRSRNVSIILRERQKLRSRERFLTNGRRLREQCSLADVRVHYCD